MSSGSGSTAGRLLGILAFLAGVALIVLTFQQAYTMFSATPAEALNVKPDAPLNVNETVDKLIQNVLKVLLLLVMAGAGSLLANVGIRLFASPLHGPHQKPEKKKRKEETPSEEAP